MKPKNILFTLLALALLAAIAFLAMDKNLGGWGDGGASMPIATATNTSTPTMTATQAPT